MLYFDSLPRVLTPDQNGNYILLTNILARAKLIDKLQNNPMLFYKYSIQDGDTPEILAEKYYDDPFKYWIILYSNQILDPIWGWPLTYTQFLGYIDSKYATDADDAGKTPFEYTNTTVHEYQKITTTIDNYTSLKSEQIVSVDFATYSSIMETENTYTIPSGSSCTVKITKKLVTIYDFEYDLNESRREIKIMNSNFSEQMEVQFRELMN